MKRYKLLKDLPTFKAGQTFFLDGAGNLCAEETQGHRELVAYVRSTLQKFPNILTDWFEELPEEVARWRAEYGKNYFAIDYVAATEREGVCKVTEENDHVDNFNYSIGNYFKTREDAKDAITKLKAYWVIKDSTKGFEPDWDDLSTTKKYYAYYRYGGWQLDICWCSHIQSLGDIYFRTREDLEESLEAHSEEWRILFGISKEQWDNTFNIWRKG